MTTPGDAEILAGVSSAAVQRATGKTWAEWLAILDAVGARQMAHPDIALYLSREQGVPDWWCQMVTVGYEQARGLRAVHQKTDGFTANASKTIGVPVARLFAAWTDDGQTRYLAARRPNDYPQGHTWPIRAHCMGRWLCRGRQLYREGRSEEYGRHPACPPARRGGLDGDEGLLVGRAEAASGILDALK